MKCHYWTSILKIVVIYNLLLFITTESFCQTLTLKSQPTEIELINHFRMNGMKYTLEGIWIQDLHSEAKMYRNSELFHEEPPVDIDGKKVCYVLIQDTIRWFAYDEKNGKYSFNRYYFYRPTPTPSIYNLTFRPLDQPESNGIAIVKSNLFECQYTSRLVPKNDGTIEMVAKTSLTGYKVAPSGQDLLVKGQTGKLYNFPLRASGDMHYIDLDIGGESYTYLIDSGASFVSITSKMEQKLKSIGVLRESDYTGTVNLELADDSIVKAKKVNIPIIKMGDQTLSNVEAVITDASLLLGRSFINKFKSWNIDNSKNILTVEMY